MRRRVVTRSCLTALAVVAVVGVATRARAVCGDANGDGQVTVSDGVQTLRAAAGLSSSCDTDCDFDGNGTITVSDGVNVLRKAADLPAAENCPNNDNPVSTMIGHSLGLFGPLTKIGAVGGAGAASARARATVSAASICDNASGGFQQTADGFTFDDCQVGNLTLTGFLGTAGGSLDFSNLSVGRRGDVLTLVGALNVGDASGNSELSGVLQGNSQELGHYTITYEQVVSDAQGKTLAGILDFDTSSSNIVNVNEVQVTLTGGASLPVVVRFTDDSTRSFAYDTATEVLTLVNNPTPTPTASPLPPARVELSNIDDRITAFLNGTQVLQAASSGPNATQDTGLVAVEGLQCGDNVFEFRVENTVPGSGYTYRVQLQVGGTTVVDRSCGMAGSQGCNNNDQTQGEVVRDQTIFCVPCAPCTAGAGTCADPLPIPGTGRIQIHGTVAGANDVAGSCGGAVGPESIFSFTPSTTGCYEFTSCGTSFASQISIGDTICGGSGSIPESCFDGNQMCPDGSTHEYTFAFLNGGESITILLDSKGSAGGDYVLDVRPSGACIL